MLTAPGDTDIEKQYAARLARGQNDMATRYGEALALMVDNRPVEAQKILFELTKQHEGVIMLHSALGQAEVKAGQTNDALGTFKHAVKLFPRNVPITIRYAESLIAAGNAKEAHAVLLDLFNNVPPTPEQIRLTASAASAAGDTGDAYYYMGEYQIAGGNLQLAAMQYQLALAAPNLTQIQSRALPGPPRRGAGVPRDGEVTKNQHFRGRKNELRPSIPPGSQSPSGKSRLKSKPADQDSATVVRYKHETAPAALAATMPAWLQAC